MQFLRLGFAQQKDSQKLYHGLLFAENLSPFYNGEREKRGGFCVAETSPLSSFAGKNGHKVLCAKPLMECSTSLKTDIKYSGKKKWRGPHLRVFFACKTKPLSPTNAGKNRHKVLCAKPLMECSASLKTDIKYSGKKKWRGPHLRVFFACKNQALDVEPLHSL